MRAPPQGYTPRRVLLTSSTAAVLFGLFIAYATVVRPMIIAPPLDFQFDPRSAQKTGIKTETSEYAERARQHLGSHPWTADATFKSGIGNATVYFQEFEPEGGRKVKFKPFAIIWKQKGDDSGKAPLTIYSDSASVEFEKPIDFGNPFDTQSPGRVIGGLLEGKVQVTGPDNLTLDGVDFHFSEAAMSIWCDNNVSFTFQEHTGTAHGMQLELIPDEAAKKKQSFSASGVRKVTLLQNVAMNFVSKPDDDKTRKPNDKNRDPLYARVECAGSFAFVLENNVATFEDKVSVKAFRPQKPGEIDELQCDLLALVFAEKKDAKSAAGQSPNASEKAPDGPLKGLGGNLSFQRLSADALDGHRVALQSPANKMNAWMTRLVYDAETRIAVLSDPENVRVVQETNEMQSPQIELVHDPEGDVTHAKCVGAGWLKSFDPETNEVRLTAHWGNELRKYPDPDPKSKFDIIELDNQAVVTQPVEQMGLAADFIRLWFDRQSRDGKTAVANRQVPEQFGGLRPRRMRAEKNVEMFGPQMHGKTKLLEAWFEDKPARAKTSPPEAPLVQQAAAEASPSSQADKTGPAAKRSTVPAERAASAVAPGDSVADKAKQEAPNKKPTSGPMELSADHIRLLIAQYPNERNPEVAVVWSKGNIDVRQYREAGQPPLQMTGNVMQIVNQSDTEQKLVVVGEPAHVRNAQMHIEGNDINVDRVRNVAWVEGPGLLELPVEQDLEGNKLAKPQRLAIWWKHKMTFDGKQAQFLEKVVTQLEDSEVHCDTMVATMTKEFSFSEKNRAPNEEIEVASVRCNGKVQFKMQRYEGNTLPQVRQGELAELTLNRQTGEMTALGPGHIRSWERGHGRRASMVPAATVKANAGSRSNNSEWEFSRINFSGEMRGNSNQRSTTFHDRVEIVYGPVDRFGDTVNPDTGLPELGGWMRCDALTITQRKVPQTDKSYIELLAAGNAEIEGRDYHGRADQVTYDESKGVYTLSAKGNNKATVWRQIKPGTESAGQDGQTISINPEKNEILIDRSTGAGGSF